MAASATALAVAGVATAMVKTKERNAAALSQKGKSRVVLPLLDVERTLQFARASPVTTVTFFEGSCADAEAFVRERMAEVVALNPWILGSVVDGALVFDYHPEVADTSTWPDGVCAKANLPLTRSTPLKAISAALRSAIVNDHGPGQPVWRTTFVPDVKAPGERFALVASMSHVVGDGATYYSIFNMLTGTDAPAVLDPRRKRDVDAARTALYQGERPFYKSWAFLASRFVFQAHSVLLDRFGPPSVRCTARLFHVSDEWIAEQKAQTRKAGDADFISTNDAITSWFLRNFDTGAMFVNFRNRLPNCLSTDAGNYEGFIGYMRADVATPALVRRSLATFRRMAEPATSLPSSLGYLRGPDFGGVTNWASFAKAPALPKCTQDLHLPVFDKFEGMMPSTHAACIIFRPTPGKLALYLLGRPHLVDRVIASDDAALGDPVNVCVEKPHFTS